MSQPIQGRTDPAGAPQSPEKGQQASTLPGALPAAPDGPSSRQPASPSPSPLNPYRNDTMPKGWWKWAADQGATHGEAAAAWRIAVQRLPF